MSTINNVSVNTQPVAVDAQDNNEEENNVQSHVVETVVAESEPDSVSISEDAMFTVSDESDMSGISDSLHFNGTDSLFILYDQPMLWSDSVQMSAVNRSSSMTPKSM